MTIEQFLTGLVDFNFSEATLASVLYLRGVQVGTPLEDVSEKNRDLCLADLYVYVSNSSTASSGEYESDGGWQHQKSAKNVYDRAGLKRLAQELYKKWDDPKADPSAGKIVMKPLYRHG